MTIIEFFEHKSHVENIISAMLCAPDKVILLGDNKKKMAKISQRYSEIVQSRGFSVEFVPKSINRNDLMSIVSTLEDIVDENEDCIIDLSGGDDLSLVATGIVYADNADRIKLHRFNITNSKMTDCDSDGELCKSAPLELTVEELVAINGGRVIYTDEKPIGTYRWDFNDEFVDDIHVMWSLCKQNPYDWNVQIGLISRMLIMHSDPDSLCVHIGISEGTAILKEMNPNNKINEALYKSLGKMGIITDLVTDADSISFRFKNEQIKKCLAKSGQVLELFIAISASEIRDDKGNPVYTDVMSGVFIDWDGEIHPGTQKDVENEIDVILMKGLMPVFISCKNGNTDINELFKLSVVADRFGGKFVRKVLAATEIDKKEERVEAVRIRADAMDIRPWFGIHKQSETNFDSELLTLWSTK